MKRYFNNFKTTALPIAWVLAAAAALLLAPASATAGDDGVDRQERYEGEVDEMRHEQSVRIASDREPVDVRIYQRVDDTRPIWHVAAFDSQRPDDAICRSTLPGEAGDDHYDFETEVLALDNGYVLLLEALSAQDDGPLDATSHQLAFHITPRDGRIPYNCSLVARGEHTELDGGPRLEIREDDDNPRLVRDDETESINFCGIRDDEDRGMEVFDDSTGRFTTADDIDIDASDARRLSASVPDEPIPPPWTDDYYTWWTASSDIRGTPGSATVPRPQMLGDLDVSSAWIEGAEGLGDGEFVTAGVDSATQLRAIRIFPGHGGSREAFEGHGRPTRLLIGLADGDRWIVDIPDRDFEEWSTADGLLVEFPDPVDTDCISVKVLEATEGDFVDETDEQRRRFGRSVAIGEITPLSVLDGPDEDATAGRLVEEIGAEASPRRRDRLMRLGARISTAIIDAIARKLQTPDEEFRVRVVPLLGEYDYDTAIPVLQEHFRQLSPDDEDYRPTKRALANHGSLAAPALLDLLDEQDQDEKKYVDIVRVVGRVGDDVHLRRLISGLGDGGAMLRAERIRALAHGGVALVPTLISEADSRGDTAGGLDALTTLVMIGRRHFDDEHAEVDGADRLREIYRNSESRAHRIRTIEATGYFAVSDPENFLAGELLIDDPDPVIRQFAARALQRYPGDEIRLQLQKALQDRSPDVRIAAARTLAGRDDASEATDAVSAYVRSDRAWPQGMHHAFQLLAQSPRPEALEAIADIVADDLSAPATRTALRALRHAERSLETSQIESHLAEDAAPQPVLGQLIAMLGYADPEAATRILIPVANRQYAPLENRTEDELDVLAHRAFLALGKTGSSEAREFLVGVAGDDRYSDADRSQALRGLGFFSDADVVDDLRQLEPHLPDKLRERFRQTLSMINNRLAIEDAHDDVQFLIDQLDEELQRRDEAPDDGLRPQ